MTSLATIALAVIVISVLAHLVLVALALRAGLAKRPNSAIGQGLFAAFGTLIIGVGVLSLSLDLMVAKVVGALVLLTGLAVVALSRLVGVRPVNSSRP